MAVVRTRRSNSELLCGLLLTCSLSLSCGTAEEERRRDSVRIADSIMVEKMNDALCNCKPDPNRYADSIAAAEYEMRADSARIADSVAKADSIK